MKQRLLILFLGLTALCRAQTNPEDEIPIFNLDDYYEEPKLTLAVGMRLLGGSKAAFSGNGVISSVSSIGNETDTNISRNYHDGYVLQDARTGATDGKTNTWAMVESGQVVNGGADVAFNVYSTTTTDNSIRRKEPGQSLGTELLVSRDMGKIGSRMEWKLFAGVSMNGINTGVRDTVSANLLRITDFYSLNGQTPPAVFPYSAPSAVADESGNVTDTTILIGLRPDARTESNTAHTVDNYWKLKGTYLTLRLGPTLYYSIRDNLRFSLSVGPALVFSGTQYTVEASVDVPTSNDLVLTVEDRDTATLTGYYVDATMEYLITERAGLYAGAFYQTSGSYTQNITENGAAYSTDVDLSKLQGFRAGLNFKF